MPVGQPEFMENPEPRCPCVLVLDSSYSMQGRPIKELNQGLVTFHNEVLADSLAALRVELAIIRFGSEVEIIQDFATLDHCEPAKLQADGTTPMGQAIHVSLDLLAERRRSYQDNGIRSYEPWVFLITDGAPTDDWHSAAERVHEGEREGRFLFFAVGVEEADMETLAKIAPPTRHPVKLKGLAFATMFKWISDSLKQCSHSPVPGQQLALNPVNAWTQVTN